MSNRKVTVVVDGGGSGCRLGAFDDNGVLCATASDGPASLSLGEEMAWLHISRGLTSLAEQLGESDNWLPTLLCMGLSGALQNAPRERFLELLPDALETVLTTDGHAQLLGASGAQPGICLAVGTGTVLHWLDETGKIEMAGGWGFPVGDEGSGAWLGVQLLNAYIWHRDTHRQHSNLPILFQALEEKIGNDVSQIQAWTTSKRSTEIASLAPIVVSTACNGDELAGSLLELGARQCERLLDLAPESLPIYFVGGLAPIYQSRMKPSMQARMHTPRSDALNGLHALAIAHKQGTLPGTLQCSTRQGKFP